jgi:hypothetical protein
MVMRRIFGRKKGEDEKEASPQIESDESIKERVSEEVPETVEKAPEESLEYEPVEEIVEVKGGTIPYHDSLQNRLLYLFEDEEISGALEGPDAFCLEFMAMGERFRIEKESLGDIELKSGASRDNDAHIRIANDVVSELLSSATFKEFSEIYLKYYKKPDGSKFVKIEMNEDVSNLNRRGYARVPLLKLLIGAAR